jgi:hypothetical protein
MKSKQKACGLPPWGFMKNIFCKAAIKAGPTGPEKIKYSKK